MQAKITSYSCHHFLDWLLSENLEAHSSSTSDGIVKLLLIARTGSPHTLLSQQSCVLRAGLRQRMRRADPRQRDARRALLRIYKESMLSVSKICACSKEMEGIACKYRKVPLLLEKGIRYETSHHIDNCSSDRSQPDRITGPGRHGRHHPEWNLDRL